MRQLLTVATAQPRPSLADQLERITPRFDALTQRARLGNLSQSDFNDLEEEAQAIARELVAPFRGRGARPVAAPLHLSADGTKGTW
ncbi:hypothetical protein [Sphingomonas sp. 3-13AW]|uniref:hypothetical protein n=1 Tax=Sphingomonas sp. 3-13AW TaxID=3050450 RepID=UPI003BB603D4